MSVPPSLWQVEQPWEGFPQLEGDAAADVVVIGAGVTGCACALRLAQGGASVLVVEADRVASGASGRNGGFASAGTGLGLRDAAAQIGMPQALALHRATEAALVSNADWGNLSEALRPVFTGTILQDFSARVTQAIDTGDLFSRDDFCLYWAPRDYDEIAWKEQVEIYNWCIEESKRLECDTVSRRADGESDGSFHTTFAIAAFPSPTHDEFKKHQARAKQKGRGKAKAKGSPAKPKGPAQGSARAKAKPKGAKSGKGKGAAKRNRGEA